MAEPLAAVAEGVAPDSARLAVFDRQLRERLGLWQLSEPIPIDDIARACRSEPSLTRGDDTVLLPVHEKHTADPTGEFLAYHRDSGQIEYYNAAADRRETVDLAIGKTIYPAWRVRYWHDRYSPPAAAGPASEPDAPPPDRSAADAPPPDRSPMDTSATPDDPSVSEDVFEELRSFVERQKEAEREDARQRFRQRMPDQYFAGNAGIQDAVPQGREVDEYGQQRVVLRVADGCTPAGRDDLDLSEDFGLYPDTEVIVDSRADEQGFPVEATVLQLDGDELHLGVYWDRSEDKGAAEAAFRSESDVRFQVGELLNPIPFDREVEAIQAVEAAEGKATLVAGNRTPEFDEGQGIPVNEAKLNTHQLGAAKTALRAEDVYCIHGPPGTGKTRTLTEIIKAAVEENWRVLACAHSNQAVDNLLVGGSTPSRTDPSSLHAAARDGDLSMARAGSNSDNPVVRDTYAAADIWKADVVGATTSAAHTFMENEFDLVVVDEAAQASIPATLLPYSKGHRLVLAGDHKQLPPYHADERSDEEAMEASLFEHFVALFEDRAAALLRRQYRMHEAIAAFPNRAFYGGQLEHGEENRTRTLRSFPPLEALAVDGDEQRTPARSYYNELEAKATARQVSQLLFSGIKPQRIGVITPYTGQISMIRARLQELEDVDRDVREVDVATIDSFQGGERDAIVVSFVRSNPQGFSGFLTFPNEGPRRLNVALTRAKRRLVLIGNWETLTTRAPNRAPDESAADVFQALYDHLQARDLVSPFPDP